MSIEGFYTEELANLLAAAEQAGRIVIEPSNDQFFRQLGRNFPALGSNIDWSKVPNAIAIVGPTAPLPFVHAVRRRYGLAGPVEYAADGPGDFALRGELDGLVALLPFLLEVPAHRYLAATNAEWCFRFSFTDDADFGFAPNEAGIAQIGS